ncbi:MAG: hypothetical protein WC716_06770 [Chitinophagaceae bacterium]|jgi:hypothetical protein
MSNPSKFYLAHMHNKTKYRATWDPTKRFKVGDIGKLEQGVLNIYTSLYKEGILIEMSKGSRGAAMDYTSHESVTIKVKLKGTVPATGSEFTTLDAGFSFDFKGNNSIVFQTSNHQVCQLINLAEIEHAVLEKYNQGNWDKDWVIITELIEADTATIIISNSSNGILELKASANLGTGTLTLTDAALGLSVLHEKGSTFKYIAQNEITPLYRVMGLRSAFLSNLSIGTRGQLKYVVSDERLEILDYDEREHSE